MKPDLSSLHCHYTGEDNAMIWTGLLDNTDVPDVLSFYTDNVRYGLRAPMKGEWQDGRLGKELFLVGVRIRDTLVAVAWIAWKSNFVHLVFTDDTLSLADEGPFADSGGWCIRKDLQGRELFQLLTATVLVSWFKDIRAEDAPPLWGRMMGLKASNGMPLFWSEVGQRVTGLSYRELLDLPFGSMEREILAHWPKESLTISSIPTDVLAAKGQTFPPLVSAGNRLARWGIVNTSLYVPTSLNFFNRATGESIRECVGDLSAFLQEARDQATVSLGM